jgi:DNA replication protein DnaC
MNKTQEQSNNHIDVRLRGLCKELRLPTVAKHYPSLARQAIEKQSSYPEYLRALLEEELTQRAVNRRRRLIRQARFPLAQTLDTYDFTLMPSLNKQMVLALARGHFVAKQENVVCVGQIGTGKTHLATAIGYAACELGYRVRFFTAAGLVNELIEAHEQQRLTRFERSLMKQQLIIIDELGFLPFSQQGAHLLFSFISQRYQRGSLLITTNLPFSDWTQVFEDERLLGALLDRLTHHCHILEFMGESVRFRQSQTQHALASSDPQPLA